LSREDVKHQTFIYYFRVAPDERNNRFLRNNYLMF
jgi:hypothetical protein